MTKPQLGRRSIITYNRLARDLAALNYVLRVAKPSGMVGDLTLRQFNSIRHDANRLFCREVGMPRFHMIDLSRPHTVADFAIFVARLTMAATSFEERYAHVNEFADEDEAETVEATHLSSIDQLIPSATL